MLEINDLSKLFENYSYFNGSIVKFQHIGSQLYGECLKVDLPGNSFIVKKYESGFDKNRLLFTHEVQRDLLKVGFPLPKIETTKDNTTIVQVNGVAFVVQQWMDGECYSQIELNRHNDYIVDNIGMLIGKLHRFVSERQYEIENDFCIHIDSILAKPSALIGSLLAANRFGISGILKLKLKVWKNSYDRWIITNHKKWVKALSILNKINIEKSYFDHIIPIHNDINWENILFDKDNKIKAVIDFDNMHYAPRAYEVGAAAIVIAGADRDRLKRFLNNYSTASGFVDQKNTLYCCMLIKCLSSIAFSAQAYIDGKKENIDLLYKWSTYLSKCLDYVVEEIELLY